MNQEEQTQKEKQQEIQQMVIELNILDSRLREMQQQLNLIDQQATELQILENNIDEIGKTKKDSETLSQIGQGIFVKSKIEDTKEVFVNIGSKIVVKKSPEEAKQVISERKKQIMNIRNMIIQELNAIIINIQLLEKEIQKRTS